MPAYSAARASLLFAVMAAAVSFARTSAAFSVVSAWRGSVVRTWRKSTAPVCLRPMLLQHQPIAARNQAGFHYRLALGMSADKDADGPGELGDKNITVGPSGINYEGVGAVGNLRASGKGFQAPDAKKSVDVGANFKVKSKKKLSKEIDQNSAKEGKAGSAYNLKNLVDFPCLFQLKVVGYRQGEFVEDILDLIGNVLGTNGRELKHSFRDRGQWRSITVTVPVDSAPQLYKVYEAIDSDPRVKFKF